MSDIFGLCRLTLVVSLNIRLNPDFCLLTDDTVCVTEVNGVIELFLFALGLIQVLALALLGWGAE